LSASSGQMRADIQLVFCRRGKRHSTNTTHLNAAGYTSSRALKPCPWCSSSQSSHHSDCSSLSFPTRSSSAARCTSYAYRTTQPEPNQPPRCRLSPKTHNPISTPNRPCPSSSRHKRLTRTSSCSITASKQSQNSTNTRESHSTVENTPNTTSPDGKTLPLSSATHPTSATSHHRSLKHSTPQHLHQAPMTAADMHQHHHHLLPGPQHPGPSPWPCPSFPAAPRRV
jgi:hypothetical protein